MSLFGVTRRRAALIIAMSTTIVAATWLLNQRYPEVVTDSILVGVVLAFMSTIVLGGIRDWIAAGEPDPPEFFTHASDRLGRPTEILGYPIGNTDSADAQFFRTPPTWTDFEADYIIEHPTLDSINSDITTYKGNLILIEGPPASGKSTLLFSLAHRLVSNNRLRTPPVYILELKTTRRNLETLTTDLERLPSDAILLVDDVHLEPLDIVEFAKVADHTPATLVYATRPVRNYSGDLNRRLEGLAATKYTLEASDIAADHIDRFLSTLDLSPNEHERVAEQCLTYQHDLYALEAALRTYRQEGDVSDTRIHEWIADRMLGTDTYDGVTVNRGHFLIAIACLYRFEVVVTRDYLVSFLGLPKDSLYELVKAGDILTPTGNKYGLHHSSVAELIIQAANGPAMHNIPQPLRSADSELDWETAAVHHYITEEPHLAINTLAEIANTQANGRRMAKKLIEDIDPNILATGIDPAHTTVENLGSFFYLYLGHDIDPSASVRDPLIDFADNCVEANPAAWGWTTNVLARLDISAATEFGENLAPVLADAAPELIADTLTSISYGDIELSKAIAASIDPDHVSNRLNEQDISPVKLAMIIAKLVWVDPDRFNQVATRFATLLLEIEPTEFPMVLCRVAWGNQSSAKRMLAALHRDDLADYLNTITDSEQFYHVLAAMYLVAPSDATALKVTPPDHRNDEFVIASQKLLTTEITDPIQGLQHGVNGPAHAVDAQLTDAAVKIAACRDLTSSTLTAELEDIARVKSPEDCLRGLLALPPETITAVGREHLANWLSETIDTTALPEDLVSGTHSLILDSESKPS